MKNNRYQKNNLESNPDLTDKENWHLKHFLQYHDQDFISEVYQSLFGRAPDPEGFDHYLNALRKGIYSKVEIVGRLRYSPEGRARKTSVKGLLIPFSMRMVGKIPILGYVVRWFAAWFKIPFYVKKLENFEASQAARERSLQQQIGLLKDELYLQLAAKPDKEQLTHLSETFAGSVNDMKRNLLDQQRRLSRLLDEAGRRLPDSFSDEQITHLISEKDHMLDAMYASFEDGFRGTREEIKDRLRVYMKVIEQACAGTEEAPVLDLGCGRGEWLELLKENQKIARGVDLNQVFVSECQDLGLDIIEQDALSYMENIKTSSLGAVTGFHLIEHLPVKILIALLDETLRVLRPGGVVIFETPNPENIKVGSCNFYIDPTHRNPLPPITAKHLLEARGFVRCDIQRLHPFDEKDRNRDMVAGCPPELIEELYGPQDYAVIGHK